LEFARIVNDSAGYVAPPEWAQEMGRAPPVRENGWYRPTDGSRELCAEDLGPPGTVEPPPIAKIALDL
jgi:hypothetical protein